MTRWLGCCAVLLLIPGCAERRIPRKAVSVIPHECVTGVELTPKSACYRDERGQIHCTDIKITYKTACEQVQVGHEADVPKSQESVPKP